MSLAPCSAQYSASTSPSPCKSACATADTWKMQCEVAVRPGWSCLPCNASRLHATAQLHVQ